MQEQPQAGTMAPCRAATPGNASRVSDSFSADVPVCSVGSIKYSLIGLEKLHGDCHNHCPKRISFQACDTALLLACWMKQFGSDSAEDAACHRALGCCSHAPGLCVCYTCLICPRALGTNRTFI